MLIDTPGMRELGNIDIQSGIDKSFSDIIELSSDCRYRDCTHTHEAGCSVLRAVKSGSLNEAHYQDYLKLKKESEHYQLSYLEKRRKDKKFGQFIKSAQKQNKKKWLIASTQSKPTVVFGMFVLSWVQIFDTVFSVYIKR